MLVIPKVLAIFLLISVFFLAYVISVFTQLNSVFYFVISTILFILSMYAFIVPNPGGIMLELGSLLLFIYLTFSSILAGKQEWIIYIIFIFALFFIVGSLFDRYSSNQDTIVDFRSCPKREECRR